MSIRFHILKLIIQLAGVKKRLSLPQDKLLADARKQNSSRCFKIPKRKNLRYTDQIILNSHHCLKIETQQVPSKRALLFLFGGGHIIAPNDGDVKTAEKMGTASGRDVWFPYYPLCIDGTIKASFEMIYATYREMLREYAPENIAVLGFSSGGALALGLCAHNNEQAAPLPMPGLMIVSSPGSVPASEEEINKMQELNKHDILVDISFMTTIRSIMEHGTTVPEYMISGTKGNFTNFPMTHFYYGSDEILSAEAPYFAKAYEAYNAPCQIHIGRGMCHCYPALTLFPEGKQAQEEMIELLS